MERKFMKGNEALAEAAVRAGCRFLPDILSPRKMKYRNTFQGECRKWEEHSCRENLKSPR